MKSGIFSILFLTLLLAVQQAQARPATFEKLDYEACRILVEEKEILSLEQLSRRVTELQLGHMIDMMLLKTETDYIYEMEIAEQSGEIRFFYIDARTGKLIDKFDEEKSPDKEPFFLFDVDH